MRITIYSKGNSVLDLLVPVYKGNSVMLGNQLHHREMYVGVKELTTKS